MVIELYHDRHRGCSFVPAGPRGARPESRIDQGCHRRSISRSPTGIISAGSDIYADPRVHRAASADYASRPAGRGNVSTPAADRRPAAEALLRRRPRRRRSIGGDRVPTRACASVAAIRSRDNARRRQQRRARKPVTSTVWLAGMIDPAAASPIPAIRDRVDWRRARCAPQASPSAVTIVGTWQRQAHRPPAARRRRRASAARCWSSRATGWPIVAARQAFEAPSRASLLPRFAVKGARLPMATTLPYPAACRHGLARLPQGVGRQRADPDQAAAGRLSDVARLCRRRRGAGQHLRLSRFGQGGKPRGDRRGDCREWPGRRHRLHGQARPTSSARASRMCSRSPARSNMSRSSPRSTRPRRRSPTPISTWCRGGHRRRPQADPAPLQLSSRFPKAATIAAPSASSPSIRGDLVSRRPDAILREAEKLVAAGTKELLVISQDTSAYGLDLKHAEWPWKGEPVRAHMTDLARELGKLEPAMASRAASLRLSLPSRRPASSR